MLYAVNVKPLPTLGATPNRVTTRRCISTDTYPLPLLLFNKSDIFAMLRVEKDLLCVVEVHIGNRIPLFFRDRAVKLKRELISHTNLPPQCRQNLSPTAHVV